MKTLYEASNAIEAQLIKNMLEQIDIESHIHGDFLQGGIGDLQAFGLVRIMVAEDSYDEARQLIDDWQSAEPIKN
jgi:hypothetical protein